MRQFTKIIKQKLITLSFTSPLLLFLLVVSCLVCVWIGGSMFLEANTQGFTLFLSFLLVCVSTCLLYLVLREVWIWYTDIPDPLTPEEWKIVGHKTMIEEGIIDPD